MKMTEDDSHGIRNALLIINGNQAHLLDIKECDEGALNAIKAGSDRVLKILEQIERGSYE